MLLIISIGASLSSYSLVAYAGGPRLDYDEAYTDVPGAPECWVDGYDAGFAGKYDQDRAKNVKTKEMITTIQLGDMLAKTLDICQMNVMVSRTIQ